MFKGLALGMIGLVGSAATAAGPGSAPASPPLGPICGAHLGGDASADLATATAAQALLAGYGTGGFPIRTSSAKAQAYFDNGMQLAHAFAHKAATSAFQAAERMDPACAMCVWGEAWSRGPTINFGIKPEEQKPLAALADKAASLAAGGPETERQLTAALQHRYIDGGGGGPGDYAFARAMDGIARAHPDDNEIAVITADAWMIPSAAKRSQDNLPRAIALLQGALARAPNDTGAIHFYIHATEMDGVGAQALPYAERLQALAPAASHLVHMPSHTYYWTGRYRQAEQSNLDAVAIDEANARRMGKADVFELGYHNHNVHFGLSAALMDGDAAGGLQLAQDELARLPKTKPDDGYQQTVLASAYSAEGRYAAPASVAALAEPAANLPYVRAMWRYARGEAAARAGDAAAVRREADGVTITAGDLKAFKDEAKSVQAVVQVANLVLIGRAAMIEHRYDAAVDAYRGAATIQQARLEGSRDPPAFWYPVRRSLAEALFAAGRIPQAQTEIAATLRSWPWDPLSLKVQAQIEQAHGQAAEANRDLGYARDGWSGELSSVAPSLV